MTIERSTVSDYNRENFLPYHLPGGLQFIEFETVLFAQAASLCTNYDGARWLMYELDNGGFYMAPELEGKAGVSVPTNYYTGTLSWDAFGIVISLFALNRMCWARPEDENLQAKFYQLRDYAAEHPEGVEIFGAID